MFHLWKGHRKQMGVVSWTSAGRIHRRVSVFKVFCLYSSYLYIWISDLQRCLGCAGTEAVLLSANVARTRRFDRETPQLRAVGEMMEDARKSSMLR